jgi:predicted alpha/beta hydrolase
MMGKNIPLWVRGLKSGRMQYVKRNEIVTKELPEFDFDHPFRVGRKSFVAYPYGINVKQIEPLRLYLEKKGYELSIYTYSEYSESTIKVMILHKDDDYDRLDFSEVVQKVKDNTLYWKSRELKERIHL